MKALNTIFLLLLAIPKIYSQDIVPITTTNTSWMFTVSSDDDGGNYGYKGYILSTDNDTVINGLNYTNLNLIQNWEIINFFGYFTDDTNYNLGHIAAFRQDSGRVYIYEYSELTDALESGGDMLPSIYPIPNDTDFLLYDFNVEVGDTVSFLGYPVNIVVSIENVLLADGLTHKKINFNGTETGFQSWIDGVGSNFGFLAAYLPYYHLYHVWFTLDCFNSNSTYLYGEEHCELIMVSDVDIQDSPVVEVYPSPFQNELVILNTAGQSDKIIQITDLHGKIISSSILNGASETIQTTNWPAGIYLITIINDANEILIGKAVKM